MGPSRQTNNAPTAKMRETTKGETGEHRNPSNGEVTTAWPLARAAFKNLAMLQLAALSHHVCELSLSPIYGSIPASAAKPESLLIPLIMLTGMLTDRRMNNIMGVLPVAGYLAPVVQALLYRFSGRLGPYWGPLLSYAVTSFPIICLSLLSSADLCTRAVMHSVKLHASAKTKMMNVGLKGTIALLLAYALTQSMAISEWITNVSLARIGPTLGVFSSRFGLHALLAMYWTSMARSKATFLLGILSSFYIVLFTSHVPVARNTASLNATLLDAGYSLVARQESLTGYVSVLDNLKEGFRVMRCDHSLLGGEWINRPDGHPAVFNEPIYSIFVILEAVRLVEGQLSQVGVAAGDSEKSALVIGLGIGTAPSALITHGVHTTTLEIDPIVHQYATQHFSLPPNHTSITGDAVKVVDEMRNNTAKLTYDYIIHDVFTGGAEPIDLFTQEFLTGLHNLLSPDGTIAINYAGDLLLPSALSVITTILSVFSICRIFREAPRPVPTAKEDFTNLVLFCRKTSGPFTFRHPTEADLLGSSARRENLFPRHEVTDVKRMMEGKGQIIRRGQTKWLEASQVRSARGHWHVMRKVLPDVIWESW